MATNKKLIILDLNGVFFLQIPRNEMVSYKVHQVYSEVKQHNSAIAIYQDPETVAFLNQLLSVPGTTVAIWSPKHESNARLLIENIDVSRMVGNVKIIGRDLCKMHPTVPHGVQKWLDDVWQSAGINEFRDFSEKNTVIVDCSRSVIACNPPNNVVVATPMNVARYRGEHYLTDVLALEIDKKFAVLDHAFHSQENS